MSGPLAFYTENHGNPVISMNSQHSSFSEAIKAEALRLGFDACGIAAASPADPEDHLGNWLRHGFHADMEWIARTKTLRQDVTLKLPGTNSVIMVARNYYAPDSESTRQTGRIARYARGRDYHTILFPLLKRLAAFLNTLQEGILSYAEVDTGPVLERTWAARAGLGWIGKNGLLIRKNGGSWYFLGAILTTLELPPDPPLPDYCGQCRACLDACPTNALIEPRILDAQKCIAYHTIENRGEIPESLHSAMGAWIFGCDLCQEACPWNRFAEITTESQFLPQSGIACPDLEELLQLDEAAFKKRFKHSPLLRAKHSGILRNARIARANT